MLNEIYKQSFQFKHGIWVKKHDFEYWYEVHVPLELHTGTQFGATDPIKEPSR